MITLFRNIAFPLMIICSIQGYAQFHDSTYRALDSMYKKMGSERRAGIDTNIIAKFKELVKLVKENNATELSRQFSYPIHRKDPLPDIESPEEFITYYPILFDEPMKDSLAQINSSDIEWDGNVSWNYSAKGIWLNHETMKFRDIYPTSQKELELRKKIVMEIKSKMYPSVNDWVDNGWGRYNFVLRTKTMTVRVDYLGHESYRYVSWSKGHETSEKPDLIIKGGTFEYWGTMGGWCYTFVNGDWTYAVEYHELCSPQGYCGYLLRLSYKGAQKEEIKMNRTKQ